MKKLTARDLRKHLNNKSHDELVDDIVALFTRFDSVKDYYSLHVIGAHSDELLKRHKAVIKDEFLPSRGYGEARLSVARKAVMDYKKASVSPAGLADLMLFYVEMGVQYTLKYGDIDEPFYNSMESMYENALKQMKKYQIQEQFESRCRKVVQDTEGIGWGFHDTLADIYNDYFES